MKRLVIMTFLSTPAFGGAVKLTTPELRAIAHGDQKTADELAYYCIAVGKSFSECARDLAGEGNLKVEATKKCVLEANKVMLAKTPNLELFRQQAGVGYSGEYPIGTPHKDENGTHVHMNSGWEGDRAVDQYKDKLYQEALNRAEAARGSREETTGGKFDGELGISGGVASVSISPGASHSTTITKPALTPAEVAKIKTEAERARQYPFTLGNVKPAIVCLIWSPTCMDGNKSIPNPHYDPKAKDDSKAAEESKKADEKKGAENPPKSEETPSDFADIGYVPGKGEMVAVHTGPVAPNAPKFATPVAEDYSALTPLESCVRKETKRLTDKLGRLNVDPNSLEANETEDETAKKLLKFGYCDEQVMGKAACLAKKIQEDSVVAVTIQEERKEAAKQALEYYKLTGMCDSNALGREFCNAEKYKWETTPAGRLEIPTEGGRILKPIRSSDIPKVNN